MPKVRNILTLKNTTRSLFLLLIISLGFMEPPIFLGDQRLTPTDLLFPLLALLWVVSLLTGQIKFKWHKFYFFAGLYFAAMLISAVFSIDPRASFIKLIGEAYLIGLAVLAFNLIDNEKDIKDVARAWLCGAATAVTIGLFTIVLFYFQPESAILQYTTYHYGAVPVGNYPRLSSTFISASMFCNYLNVSLVMLFIAGRSGWLGKSLFWILLAAIVVCAIFTISAGLGGIFLSIGIWVWLLRRQKGALLSRLALGGGIAAAVLFLALNLVALQSYQEAPYALKLPGVETALLPSSRLLVWQDAWKTFAADPLTGKGLGQAVSAVVFQNTDGTHSLLTDAHNIFLNVAAQEGLIGLFAILALAAYLLRLSNRPFTVQTADSFVLKGLGLAFLSAFVYQGLTGSFEDARHLWVLIGMIPACRVVSKI